MLANILALAVGLGSLALYMAAFFFPEVHRKNDFLWSGVGLFYALVLWFCARQITGAVLLGQIACVLLLGALGWQIVTLRRSLTPTDLQTPVSVEAFNQSTTETVSQIKTNLRNGSWRKSLPKLAARVKESLQFGFDDSSANRLSRLARARSAKKRKVKQRYDYEFVEDAPPNRKVQPAVIQDAEIELTEDEISISQIENLKEDLTRPDISIPPTPSAGEAIFIELQQASLDEPTGLESSQDRQATSKATAPLPKSDETPLMQAVDSTLEETVDAEPTDGWSDPSGGAEASLEENWEIEEIQASISDDWTALESPPPAPPPVTSSIKQPSKTAFEKVIIIKDWVQELIASFTRPKPKYSMIELPPRPPSIPRPTAKTREKPEAGIENEFEEDEFGKDEFEEDELEAVLDELDEVETPESRRQDNFSADSADNFEDP